MNDKTAQRAPDDSDPDEHADADGKDVDKLDWVVDWWNGTAADTGLAAIKGLTQTRRAALRARIREHGVDIVREVMNAPRDSSFLRGGGDRGWRCSFDWIIKASNFLKVAENQYLDKQTRGSTRSGGDAVGRPGGVAVSPTSTGFALADIRRFRDHPEWEAYEDYVLERPPGEAMRFAEWIETAGSTLEKSPGTECSRAPEATV